MWEAYLDSFYYSFPLPVSRSPLPMMMIIIINTVVSVCNKVYIHYEQLVYVHDVS